MRRLDRPWHRLLAGVTAALLVTPPVVATQELGESGAVVEAFSIGDVVPALPTSATGLGAANATKGRPAPVSARGTFSTMSLWRIRASKEAESAFAAGQPYTVTRRRRFWGKDRDIQLKLEGQVKLEIDKPLDQQPPSEQKKDEGVKKPPDISETASRVSPKDRFLQLKSHHGFFQPTNRHLAQEPSQKERDKLIPKGPPIARIDARSKQELCSAQYLRHYFIQPTEALYHTVRSFLEFPLEKMTPVVPEAQDVPDFSGVYGGWSPSGRRCPEPDVEVWRSPDCKWRVKVIQEGRKIRIVVVWVPETLTQLFGWQVGDEVFKGEIISGAFHVSAGTFWPIRGQLHYRYFRKQNEFRNLSDFWAETTGEFESTSPSTYGRLVINGRGTPGGLPYETSERYPGRSNPYKLERGRQETKPVAPETLTGARPEIKPAAPEVKRAEPVLEQLPAKTAYGAAKNALP